jgi:hypothetical protein
MRRATLRITLGLLIVGVLGNCAVDGGTQQGATAADSHEEEIARAEAFRFEHCIETLSTMVEAVEGWDLKALSTARDEWLAPTCNGALVPLLKSEP